MGALVRTVSAKALAKFKPSRHAAYDLCSRINDGHCSCSLDRTGPCRAWWLPLYIAKNDVDEAERGERARMADGLTDDRRYAFPRSKSNEALT